jgi:hypothetical protein
VANQLAPVGKAKFFDNSGRPAYGYKLFTYAAGTSNKLATYPDSDTVGTNTNPIILDFRGEANIWLPPNTAYKFVFSPPNDTDPPTAPIWTVDQIIDSQLITLYGGVDTGIADAYVLNFVSNFSAYTDGIVIYWVPANANTGAAATINVNGLGPVPLRMPDGSNPPAGMIPANGYVQIIYRGGVFHVMFSSQLLPERGNFTATVTGIVGNPTGTVHWTRNGTIVTMNIPQITGTASGAVINITGIPASLVGDVTFGINQRQFFPVINGGTSVMGTISVAGAPSFNVSPYPVGAGFAGAVGIGPGVITYYSPVL